MIVEQCACGGSIVAPSLDRCAPAVSRHNRSEQHRTWRGRGGFTPYTPQRDLLLIGLQKSHAIEIEQGGPRDGWAPIAKLRRPS